MNYKPSTSLIDGKQIALKILEGLKTEVEKLNFLRTLFEVCSAFGTVGVSTGNGGVLSYSALFSDFGKLNIILLMIVGRVGVLAFTLAVVGQALESRIKYSEGKVIL